MAADTKAAGGPPHVALRVALGLVYCTGAILRYIVCKIIFLLSDYAGLKSVESFVCGQLKSKYLLPMYIDSGELLKQVE